MALPGLQSIHEAFSNANSDYLVLRHDSSKGVTAFDIQDYLTLSILATMLTPYEDLHSIDAIMTACDNGSK